LEHCSTENRIVAVEVPTSRKRCQRDSLTFDQHPAIQDCALLAQCGWTLPQVYLSCVCGSGNRTNRGSIKPVLKSHGWQPITHRQQWLAWQREPLTQEGPKLNTLTRSIHQHTPLILQKNSLCSGRFVGQTYVAKPTPRVRANRVGSQPRDTDLVWTEYALVGPGYRRFCGGVAWRP